jgi:hypothetical protein
MSARHVAYCRLVAPLSHPFSSLPSLVMIDFPPWTSCPWAASVAGPHPASAFLVEVTDWRALYFVTFSQLTSVRSLRLEPPSGKPKVGGSNPLARNYDL